MLILREPIVEKLVLLLFLFSQRKLANDILYASHWLSLMRLSICEIWLLKWSRWVSEFSLTPTEKTSSKILFSQTTDILRVTKSRRTLNKGLCNAYNNLVAAWGCEELDGWFSLLLNLNYLEEEFWKRRTEMSFLSYWLAFLKSKL